ncbi:amidohydrolase family protein [Candidatus Peregrinibacteria bacterium]|nr:amidohydrolase family protein [Candidatus Peregrinibacteria bacterium]
MKSILITSGRIIDPANKTDQIADIFVKNEKISQIGKNLKIDADILIDAKNKVVSPGFVDMHSHLREPGREDKETIYTASLAAASGGITSIVAMPNTDPVADDQTVIEFILSKAAKESLVNIFPCGSITVGEKGNKISEIWELKQSGAIAVSDDGRDVQNADLYRKAMQYCRTHNMPIISHTEDHNLSEGGLMHEGTISSKLGLKGIPACSEDIATAKIICLVEDTGHKAHFTHVSSKGAVDLIALAQSKKLKITADTTPHHFSLTDEAVEKHGTFAKVHPPLRSENHRKALIKALKNNTISTISSDHAPHLWKEKECEFDKAAVGISGFETFLPLIITNLFNPKHLSLSQALAKITINPAKILGLKKGTLSPGADADICIFDPKESFTVDRFAFKSKGKNSPFHGMKVFGKVHKTIVNGEIRITD